MKHRALLFVVACAVLVAACGGDKSASDTDHNDADLVFVRAMLPHHQGALDMATLAASRSTNDAVKGLAAQIKAGQQPEIDTMNLWLASWRETATTAAGHTTDDGHDAMEMSGEADMAILSSLSGDAFDRKFLVLMGDHHQDAIDMAKVVIEDGEYRPVKTMAETIIKMQADEMNTMGQLIQSIPVS